MISSQMVSWGMTCYSLLLCFGSYSEQEDRPRGSVRTCSMFSVVDSHHLHDCSVLNKPHNSLWVQNAAVHQQWWTSSCPFSLYDQGPLWRYLSWTETQTWLPFCVLHQIATWNDIIWLNYLLILYFDIMKMRTITNGNFIVIYNCN